MKYMPMIYGNHEGWNGMSKDDYDAIMRIHAKLQEELEASGELIETNALGTEDAKTVRASGGIPTVTDGPFTEAKEMLAGYYLVDCANAERATEAAARLGEAEFSLIEVRSVTAA